MFKKNDLLKTTFVVITILSLAACASQPGLTASPAPAATATFAPATAAPQAQSITLRLATYDDRGSASEPYILEFANQVSTLSGGSLVIEPNFGVDSEQHTIQQVLAGLYDLGLVASRAWDTATVTSFQALQAPFLITNDALAIAVATSDTARQMLDSLSAAGGVGLTLWPEDLRHPFSVTDKPLLSPDDFKGLQIRTPPSAVSNRLIQQLGGSPMYDDSGYQGAESGLRQGGTLNGTPIATGNVTFYPKFQVLFANAAAFKKLSQAQQKVLTEAAAAAQKKAIAEHPSDAAAGAAWCANNGSIVLASKAQVAAFEQAAQPIFDSLEKDPQNAKYIAAIRALKASTPASPGAQFCQPASTATESIPDGQLKLVRTIDGGSNPFAHPNSLAIDSQGNLYIMMNLTNQIQVFDPSGKFIRMWGKTGSGNGEFNFFTDNPLVEGGAIAMGPNDTLYVADTYNNRVQAFKPDGTYIGQWGSRGQKDGQFLSPVYIAVDPQGNVSVLDWDQGTIQTFDANGKFLSKITEQDYGGGHLNALVIASDGTMYVSDTTAPRIMVFKAGTHTGDIKVKNQYVNGYADKKGNFFLTTDGQVVKFDASGKPVYQFTGISVPSAVAVGANGLVYLSDVIGNTVKVFQEP